MKITDIQLENLGPYIGINELAFSVNQPGHKVVLVGGKNGAGKTTLFNTIRIGLYGCRAYGFESNNTKYLDIISQLINSSARLKKDGRASVKICILMDDGKFDYHYSFERSWKLTTRILKEELIVQRDGVTLSEVEKSDFESYLLQLIPPDMFRFYFFDGESISNFVFNGIKNTDFRNAFLKLCGLDTMDLIHENFLRISNMRKKDATGAYQAYQEALQLQTANHIHLEQLQSERASITSEIVRIDDALAKGESSFLHRGGISKKEYQAMQTQINKEEAKREASRKWLKDTANDVLPFIVLRQQLVKLKSKIMEEEHRQSTLAFKEVLLAPEVRQKLNVTFSGLGIEYFEDLSDKVISVLAATAYDDGQEQLLNLSKQERLELLAKINNLLAFDTGRVKSATKVIDASLTRVKQIRRKMEKSDDSEAEKYFAEKESLLSQKQAALQKLLDVERRIDTASSEQAEIVSKVKKAQSKYEDFLKAKSVSDVTAKALLAFSDLQKRLYKKYISDVEASFRECFSSLINKSDLIDGIKIDEQLQVYPYKFKTFLRSELKRMIQQSGENYFISQLGNIAFDAYTADDGVTEEITLPVEVKQQLSAGEKQIFIMALYQALSHLNKVSVPYIIDTPFARIDGMHRQNILNNFFMNLKGQIIILSTDEEIVDEYASSISHSVSNYYLLQHTENSGTKIIPNRYFGGEGFGL